MPSAHLQPKGWGPQTVLIGIAIAVFLQLVTSLAFFGLISASGHEFKLSDTGDDPFDKVQAVLSWSGERADAAAKSLPLPDAPTVFADVFSIKLGFATTAIFEVALIAMVGILVKADGTRALLKTFNMGRYSFDDLWRPGAAVIGLYIFVILYQMGVEKLGVDVLVPRSTVPEQITRDDLALAMAGVLGCIAAPLAEELFFRGIVVTGLIRWGFWPAASASAGLFTLSHLDIGSLIPFFVVGLVLARLYYWRGCLWDSIAFHFLFNTTSFVILVSQR